MEHLDAQIADLQRAKEILGMAAGAAAASLSGIESVFAVLKRGILGVFHQVSVKHLGRYVQEFSFRLNEGNVARKTTDRIDSFIAGVAGKRLTYDGLIQ
jgi:hypothetical protein